MPLLVCPLAAGFPSQDTELRANPHQAIFCRKIDWQMCQS